MDEFVVFLYGESSAGHCLLLFVADFPLGDVGAGFGVFPGELVGAVPVEVLPEHPSAEWARPFAALVPSGPVYPVFEGVRPVRHVQSFLCESEEGFPLLEPFGEPGESPFIPVPRVPSLEPGIPAARPADDLFFCLPVVVLLFHGGI